jgi:O-antigen/teichoic acid export membrane protein
MKAATFAKDTGVTVAARVLGLVLALLASVVIARALGPEGTGVYTLATLFPVLVLVFLNLGVGAATVYYVAQDKYPLPEVLGSNVILCVLVGAGASLIGLLVAIFLHGYLFPTVALSYLLLALLLIPVYLFSQYYANQILLGARRISDFNAATVLARLLLLALVVLLAVTVGLRIEGAIWATFLSSLVVCLVLYPWIRRVTGGVRFRLNASYVRDTFTYGLKAHLGNIVGFLNYRVEVFMLGVFVPASAVGFYSVAVGLAERLWFLSESASIVLFPTVSAEKDEHARKTFTPLVSRSVLLITAVGAVGLFLLSQWVVVLLYSSEYVPSVHLFRILLPGIVFLSVGRILANDIAGRGRPLLNTYVGGIGIVVQVLLNLAWIPRFGPTGAAWATTIAYGLTSAVWLWVYMRLSGNSLTTVVVPQTSDWHLYRQLVRLAWSRLRGQLAHC